MMNNNTRNYGFRRKDAVIKLKDESIYRFFNNNAIVYPLYQRGYSWEIHDAADFVSSITFAARELEIEALKECVKDMGTMIIVKEKNNNKAMFDNSINNIVDGQSRLMTLNLFILAFNAYIQKNKIACPMMTPFNMFYQEADVNNEYTQFLDNRKRKSRFSSVYNYIYKEIAKNAAYLAKMKFAVENCYTADFIITEDATIGYDQFTQTNASGRPMDAMEFIHSTLKEFSKRYNVYHKYDPKTVVPMVQTYYMVCNGKNTRLTTEVLKKFMDNYIVKDAESLEAFYGFIENVGEFHRTTLYQSISKLHRNRIAKLAYALIATGRDASGSDEEINNLMKALINFSIIASYKGLNPSGSTGIKINQLIKKISDAKSIAKGTDSVAKKKVIRDIFNDWQDYVESVFKNNPTYMTNLFEGIDDLSDDIHEAIMLLDIWDHNKSAMYKNLWLEHSLPQDPAEAWKAAGWLDDEDFAAKLCKNIGNKFLLAERLNREADNRYLDEKDLTYKKVNTVDTGLCTKLNTFDAMTYKKNREKYANARKQQYIDFLYSLPLGDIMIVK
jgi:hypothetical protein